MLRKTGALPFSFVSVCKSCFQSPGKVALRQSVQSEWSAVTGLSGRGRESVTASQFTAKHRHYRNTLHSLNMAAGAKPLSTSLRHILITSSPPHLELFQPNSLGDFQNKNSSLHSDSVDSQFISQPFISSGPFLNLFLYCINSVNAY